MKPLIAGALIALAGCATVPMTPEQHQIMMQSLQNMPRNTYQVIQPQPLPAAPTRIHPITCQTYRNIGGAIQTDCQ